MSGPPAPSRLGWRSNALGGGSPRDAGCSVLRVDPVDGVAGVFRDAPVVVRFSQPVDPASISSETFRVEDPDGAVPGLVHLTRDACVAIWRGQRLLAPGVLHFVVVSGVRDARDAVPHHMSRFVSCALTWSDLGR